MEHAGLQPPPPIAPAVSPRGVPPEATREPEPAWFEPPTEGLATVKVDPALRAPPQEPGRAAGPRAGHRIEEHTAYEGFDGPTPPGGQAHAGPP